MTRPAKRKPRKSADPPPHRILVCGGTVAQAIGYISRNRDIVGQARPLESSRQLVGIRGGEIRFVGTYWERGDWPLIRQEAEERGMVVRCEGVLR